MDNNQNKDKLQSDPLSVEHVEDTKDDGNIKEINVKSMKNNVIIEETKEIEMKQNTNTMRPI